VVRSRRSHERERNIVPPPTMESKAVLEQPREGIGSLRGARKPPARGYSSRVSVGEPILPGASSRDAAAAGQGGTRVGCSYSRRAGARTGRGSRPGARCRRGDRPCVGPERRRELAARRDAVLLEADRARLRRPASTRAVSRRFTMWMGIAPPGRGSEVRLVLDARTRRPMSGARRRRSTRAAGHSELEGLPMVHERMDPRRSHLGRAPLGARGLGLASSSPKAAGDSRTD